MGKKFKITGVMIFDICLIILMIVLTANSAALSHQTKQLPIMAIYFTAIMAIADMVLEICKQYKKSDESVSSGKKKKEKVDKEYVVKVIVSVVFMFALVLGWWLLGFIITSVVVTTAFCYYLGEKRIVVVAVSSILLTMGLYLLFGYFLKIPLPTGILINWQLL